MPPTLFCQRQAAPQSKRLGADVARRGDQTAARVRAHRKVLGAKVLRDRQRNARSATGPALHFGLMLQFVVCVRLPWSSLREQAVRSNLHCKPTLPPRRWLKVHLSSVLRTSCDSSAGHSYAPSSAGATEGSLPTGYFLFDFRCITVASRRYLRFRTFREVSAAAFNGSWQLQSGRISGRFWCVLKSGYALCRRRCAAFHLG